MNTLFAPTRSLASSLVMCCAAVFAGRGDWFVCFWVCLLGMIAVFMGETIYQERQRNLRNDDDLRL